MGREASRKERMASEGRRQAGKLPWQEGTQDLIDCLCHHSANTPLCPLPQGQPLRLGFVCEARKGTEFASGSGLSERAAAPSGAWIICLLTWVPRSRIRARRNENTSPPVRYTKIFRSAILF